MAKKTVESLVIELSADVASLKRDMVFASRTVKRSTDGMEKSARKAAKSIAALGAGFVVGATIKKIISATKVQEQAVSQLEAGLASTGGVVGKSLDELTNKASDLQKITIFGDEQFITAQAQLLSFTGIVGEQFDKTLLLAADLSTRFGIDLKSSVLQLGKALNDPVANLSALSRSGIQFNKSQKDTIKLLAESGQLMEAQNIILGELEAQFGGSARAARDAFGGALEGLSNAFDDLFESTEGLDDAKDAVEDLTKSLQDPKTIESINNITSALISGTVQMTQWAIKAGSIISGVGKEASLAFEAIFGNDAVADVAELTAKIERLERVLSLPGGGDKGGLAKQIDELKKQRDFFARGEKFAVEDPRGSKFKPQVTPSAIIKTDPAEAIKLAEAAKLAEQLAKDQEKQAAAIRSAITAAQPALKTYLDSEAQALALLDAKKISQSEFNNVMSIYKKRLDDATGANEQWLTDIADANRFIEGATTEIEKLNIELTRATELADKGLISPETLSRTKDRIAKDLEEIKEAAKEIDKIGEALAEGMQNVVADGFVSIFKGGFDDVLNSFGELLVNMAAQAAAADFLHLIGFGGKDNKGGNLGKLFDGLFSFEGGGYTGAGSRTGGLDGRGGFLSMVHPNETVVDHTKGQSLGGTSNAIYINYTGTGDRNTDNRAAGQMGRDISRRIGGAARYT